MTGSKTRFSCSSPRGTGRRCPTESHPSALDVGPDKSFRPVPGLFPDPHFCWRHLYFRENVSRRKKSIDLSNEPHTPPPAPQSHPHPSPTASHPSYGVSYPKGWFRLSVFSAYDT